MGEGVDDGAIADLVRDCGAAGCACGEYSLGVGVGASRVSKKREKAMEFWLADGWAGGLGRATC